MDTLRRIDAGEPAATPHEVADGEDRTQAGINGSAASEALKNVRLALHNRLYVERKSTNKWSVHDREDPSFPGISPMLLGSCEDTRLNARRAVDVWTSDVSNCERLAWAAQDWLGERFPGVQTSRVGFGVDHMAAVIGTVDQRYVAQPLVRWPEHLHICDPWANTVCPAPEFPEHFARKMEKWVRDDKLIQSRGHRGWRLPAPAFSAAIADVPSGLFVRTTFSNGQIQEHRLTIDGKRSTAFLGP